MNKEDIVSFGVAFAIILILVGLVTMFVISPIAEATQKDGNRINDIGDFTLSVALGMVMLAACILMSLPK